MVKKLIVLGIDGMDFEVVMKYKKELPNIVSMMENNGYPHLRSVFPADTTPAWSTIFTGLDPSEHGIINFVNVGDRNNAYKPNEFDDSAFYGNTFWDYLNGKGYSCSVLFPMNIKLGWDINGLMITRPYKGKINIYPEARKEIYKPKIEILGNECKFTSENKLGKLCSEFFAKAAEEFRITKLAVENEECDLLFSYFSTVDGIQHDLWRHGDENHPEYPGNTKYHYVIRDMYKKIDEYIGEIHKICPDTPMLVISDHGHGARPVRIARINEMLRREGYLAASKNKNSSKKKFNLKKILKKASLLFVKKFGLPKFIVKIAKKFPVWKSLFASSNDFDWENTVAYLSDLSALKNYSYGGIRIREDITDKDKLCDEIIDKLSKIKIDGEKDKPAFLWIRRANTLYHGKYLDRYPEIIFQLDERYGADWSLGEKLFEQHGFMHKLSPGSHRYETAIIASSGFELSKTQYEMTDIYSLIINFVSKAGI